MRSTYIRWCAGLLITAGFTACAQRLHVYSPLTRVDPSGAVLSQDRGTADPRHILSPGVPRNGSSPLRLVVEMDKPDYYYLDIGQNPENAVKATLYKENFVETPAGFVPDSLQEVSIPYRGFPADFRLPGQKVVTFWLDMFVAKDATVERIKVEPQLYVDSLKDWTVYPMEVRVQEPVLPAARQTGYGPLPQTSAPADAAGFAPLMAAICGKQIEEKREPSQQLTNRDLLRRYVAQDLALAKDPVKLKAAFTKASGVSNLQQWCEAGKTPAAGPEWYLRLRDLIYRDAGAR